MQILERLEKDSFKDISKLLKIGSYEEVLSIIQSFKPKKKKDQTGITTDLSNMYWLRVHDGSMINDFFSSVCSANQIDVFKIISEKLNIKDTSTISTLKHEITSLLQQSTSDSLRPFTFDSAKDQTKGSLKVKKGRGDDEEEKSLYQEAQAETAKAKSVEKVKEPKVFNINDLIDEGNVETIEVGDENQIESVSLQKESETKASDTLMEYKIILFDYDEFLKFHSDSGDNRSAEDYSYITKLLRIINSIEFLRLKSLFFIISTGTKFSDILSDNLEYELTVPVPDEQERKTIFDIMKDLNPYLRYESTILADSTHGWTMADIKKLISNALSRFNLGLCKYESINSDYMLTLINSKKVLPKKDLKPYVKSSDDSSDGSFSQLSARSGNFQDSADMQIGKIPESLSEQLYQEAAHREYDNLSRIIRDLIANKPLDPNDMRVISDYAFILKDDPKKALSKINQAKSRIDKIMRIKSI